MKDRALSIGALELRNKRNRGLITQPGMMDNAHFCSSVLCDEASVKLDHTNIVVGATRATQTTAAIELSWKPRRGLSSFEDYFCQGIRSDQGPGQIMNRLAFSSGFKPEPVEDKAYHEIQAAWSKAVVQEERRAWRIPMKEFRATQLALRDAPPAAAIADGGDPLPLFGMSSSVMVGLYCAPQASLVDATLAADAIVPCAPPLPGFAVGSRPCDIVAVRDNIGLT